MRVDNRNALKKFIGKRIAYEATAHIIEDKRILIQDIKEKGKTKILAEHLWIDIEKVVNLENLEKDNIITFFGYAASYIDSYGFRKYNIGRVHTVKLKSEDHELSSKKLQHDNNHAKFRKTNNYKRR